LVICGADAQVLHHCTPGAGAIHISPGSGTQGIGTIHCVSAHGIDQASCCCISALFHICCCIYSLALSGDIYNAEFSLFFSISSCIATSISNTGVQSGLVAH